MKNNDKIIGIIYLLIDIIISVIAQLILKKAMVNIGEFDPEAGILNYGLSFLNFQVILGLGLYGLGMVFWLLCLTKLDLSFAYPAATLQYIFIFLGAWIIFEESISHLRLAGLAVICLGVIIMSTGMKKA
ncbi:MAG: multidrug resistance protein [Bacteroidetes bacterium]|nr:multidrug resistance protein [Bacteroidota bacterium]